MNFETEQENMEAVSPRRQPWVNMVAEEEEEDNKSNTLSWEE